MIPLGVLASAHVPADTAPHPTPVLSYSFDEGEGWTFAPTHGTTIGDTPGWWVPGVHGTALHAAGFGDDYVTRSPFLFSTPSWTTMTISAWVKIPNDGWDFTPWALRILDGSMIAATLLTPGSTGITHRWGSVWDSGVSTQSIPVDQWVHVATVWDGQTLTTYIDAVAAYSSPATTVMGLARSLYVGSDTDTYSDSCAVDDLRIYRDALTTAQIATDMTEGV